MVKDLLASSAFIMAFPFAVQAGVVCANFADHPRFRSAYQELLSDGSVIFTQPEVLVKESVYMEVSAASSVSATTFCLAHKLTWSQTQPGVTERPQNVEISLKGSEIELNPVRSPRLVARTIICRGAQVTSKSN